MLSLLHTVKHMVHRLTITGVLPVCVVASAAFLMSNTAPQAVQASGSAPYIVSGGVQMYDVPNASEAGGWDFRAHGDDTYGNGELIAVSVEFNEEVSVNGETTFRIRMGSRNRDLVPASYRGNTVIFATLIRPTDQDTDGVWIGDNSATLGHNPANYIRSIPGSNGGDPVNANLTHASLGTRSNHKVKGSATRPEIRRVRVASSPQYGDTYARGETIEIEVTFSQAVRVSGDVAARLRTEAFQNSVTRIADYARGSGTSKLVFEYPVGFFDIDNDGIAIPRNSLAKNGDVTMGIEGGGKISGQSGGLRPHLTSGGRGEDANHKVDSRLAIIPEVLTAAQWDWEASTPGSASVEIDFSIREDPGHFSEDQALVLVMGWGHISGTRFAFGLRTDVDKPGTDGSQGKGVIFNRWGTADTATYGRAGTDGWVETGNFGGPFISARRAYDWSEGNYSVRVAPDGGDDTDGRWFGMWITDKSTGVKTHMGSLKFPTPSEGEPEIQARNDVFGSLIAITGNAAINPANIPVFEAALGLPNASGGEDDRPNAATATYSLLNGVITNGDVSYDADIGKVIMRVGGSTDRSTRPGTTITGLEDRPLTASAGNAPASHDGQSAFTFQLTFSEQFSLSYKTLRDHAFDVAGGSVVKARRLNRPSNIRWEITVQPSSTGNVTVTLPKPDYCGAPGAICTQDGRELSEAVAVNVPGTGGGN